MTVLEPSKPLPAQAWDCHAHVFGPFERYPLLAERRYEPPLAPAEAYLKMLDASGFEHGVLVHASACGYDNSCTGDALERGGGRLVGVCVVDPGIDDGALEALHAQGFRAVRITETGARARQFGGALSFEDLRTLAPRLKALGWHVQLYAHCHRILDEALRLERYGMPVVCDHMGSFEVAAGVTGEVFRSFLDLIRSSNYWLKMTPIRLTKTDPSYQSVRPFHERILETIPERALFGSDWPYLSMPERATRTRELIDLFDAWTPDAQLRHGVFVDNPARLFATPGGAKA